MDHELEGREKVLVAWMKRLGVREGASGMDEELRGGSRC